MRKRLLAIPLILAMVLSAGCRIDYLFLAFVLEGIPGDPDPYPKNKWTLVFCKRFESSPFELLSGQYKLEFDMDIPAGDPTLDGPFPNKLQAEIRGYDSEGEMEFRYRTKRLKVDRSTGRVEETLTFNKDLIVDNGGELCLLIKPIAAALIPGWLAGILMEPIAADAGAVE